MPVTLEIPVIQPINALPLFVVCFFIVLDVIVGLCKAFATNSYSSTKMREGLWHKAAIIAVTILAYALEAATGLMDFSLIGWEVGTTLPIVAAVTAYVVIMEAGSVLESAVIINPELGAKKLFRLFGKFSDSIKEDDSDDDSE